MKIICAVLDKRDASHEEMSATDIKLFSILYGTIMTSLLNLLVTNKVVTIMVFSKPLVVMYHRFFFFSFESFICNHEEINENDILNDNLRSILDTGYWKYALSSFNRFS